MLKDTCMFTATCPRCKIQYEGELLGMVKLAMLQHVSRSAKCGIKSPHEIDDMITNDQPESWLWLS